MSADLITLTLRRHAVRLTPMRRTVLEVLVHSPFALSGQELEKQLPALPDRITLYRTLRTFEAKGLAHRVIDHSDTVRYAASQPPGTGLEGSHVHFKCFTCQRIYCLHHVAVPSVALPGQYQVLHSDCLLLGICERCAPRFPAAEGGERGHWLQAGDTVLKSKEVRKFFYL